MIGKTLEPEDASEKLCELLYDDSMQVRKNASLALMKMEAVTAIKPLKNALLAEKEQQVKSVMEVAINVLGKD